MTVAIKSITKKNLAKSQNLLSKEIKILKVCFVNSKILVQFIFYFIYIFVFIQLLTYGHSLERPTVHQWSIARKWRRGRDLLYLCLYNNYHIATLSLSRKTNLSSKVNSLEVKEEGGSYICVTRDETP